MSILNQLALGFGSSLPVMLQSESTECGLACLAMIAHYHRQHVDLMTLRHRHGISLKGATLADLIRVAQQMDLSARPLKLDLDDLGQLRLPCVLHWNFNHFVVLKAVSAKAVVIHDPATGVRSLSWQEVSRAFTGVALELWPDTHFRPVKPAPAIGLGGLMGRVRGLGGACGQILVLALVLEAFALLSPFFLQWVIDNVLVTADRDLLATLCLGFGLLMLMQQAVTAMRSWTLLYMGTTLNLQWRANIFAHLTRLPVQYFEKRHLGDIVSRFGAIDLIQRTLTISFMEAILDGCMALLTLSMMLLYSPMLGGIAVGAISLYLLGRVAWYGPLRRATDEQLIHAARQQTHFLETLRGIKTIKLFQRHDQRRNHWLTLLVEQINADLRVQKLQLAYKLLNGVLFGAENVLIIWCGARLVLDGNFSVGVLMAFVAYKNQFANRTSALIDKGFEFKMLQLQGARLADIVLSEPEPAGCAAAVRATDSVPRIAVNAVSFRYSEHDPLVLNEVSFTVGAGECVAIVGPSGCGKTTLLNILLGILTPASGSIAVDNVDVRNYDPGYLRAVSATVLQDDVLFAGSIADNIHFFAADADQAWVEQCAEVACISDDIRAMPMGFQTLVGDMGSVLSGGQKQRILLARALYKRPQILFLDEATSHLDVQAEQQVNARVKALNITRIIIAHRPETIASAERVITLPGGELRHDPKLPPVT